MSGRELKRVEAAARKLEAARQELAASMAAASFAGVALRPIADAAGCAVESVRRRIAEAKP